MIFLALFAGVGCSSFLFGQDLHYRGSVYGGLGYGRFFDDEGSLGAGLTYRAGGEYRWHRLGLEGELQGISFRRSDAFQVDGQAQFALANVTLYFLSKSSIQPYIKGGIGGYRTNYSFFWNSYPQTKYQRTHGGAALSLGTGIRFFINRSWSVNPEFRVMAGAGFFSQVNYASMNIAYHW